jgi:hypothetical protein
MYVNVPSKLLLLCMPLMIIGCSGGSSQLVAPVSGVDPEGIFTGTTSDGNSLFGIVTADGTADFIEYSGAFGASTITNSAVLVPSAIVPDANGQFSVPFNAYSDNSFVLPGSGTSAQGTMSGVSAVASGVTNGILAYTSPSTSVDYSLAYQAAYGTASSASTIAGTYAAAFALGNTVVSATFTITAGGSSSTASIDGTDTTLNCNYHGTINIPDTTYNAYKFLIQASGCTNIPVTINLSGLGALSTVNSVTTVSAILSDSTNGVGLFVILTKTS